MQFLIRMGAVFILGILLNVSPSFAQAFRSQTNADTTNTYTRVSLPPSLSNYISSNPTSGITITFDDSGYRYWTQEQKDAVTYAANIWNALLGSLRDVRIRVVWDNTMSSKTLESTKTNFINNFAGTWEPDKQIPTALAKSRCATLTTTGYDMEISCNPNFKWNYKTDGVPVTDNYDFTTVILHEMAHGFGLAQSYSYTSQTGTFGISDIQSNTAKLPMIYDKYVYSGEICLLTMDAAAMGSSLVGNNLTFHGAMAKAANNNTYPKLYAPSSWSSGSSVCHLDDALIKSGDLNSLMLYSTPAATVVHFPGEIVLGMFQDMGYQVNRLIGFHAPVSTTQLVPGQNFTMTWSDNLTTADYPYLNLDLYQVNQTNLPAVNIVSNYSTIASSANSINWTVPGTLANGYYFIKASDPTKSGEVSRSETFLISNQPAQPYFTPPGGSYAATLNVKINCGTPGAIIRYSIGDGAAVTASSNQYTGSIQVTTNTTINAKAFLTLPDGSVAESAITSQSYFIGGGVVCLDIQSNMLVNYWKSPTAGPDYYSGFMLGNNTGRVYRIYATFPNPLQYIPANSVITDVQIGDFYFSSNSNVARSVIFTCLDPQSFPTFPATTKYDLIGSGTEYGRMPYTDHYAQLKSLVPKLSASQSLYVGLLSSDETITTAYLSQQATALHLRIYYKPNVEVHQLDEAGNEFGTVGVLSGANWKTSSNGALYWGYPSGSPIDIQSQQTLKPSTTQKFYKWTQPDNYINPLNKLLGPDVNVFKSKFITATAGPAIKSYLVDQPNSPSPINIQFKDPWLPDNPDAGKGITRNRGIDALYKNTNTSNFIPNFSTLYNGYNYNGVFIGAGWNEQSGWNAPYYSAKVEETGIYKFINWSYDPLKAVVQNPNSAETPVAFKAPDAVITANYKGHLLTSNADELAGAGQQPKIAQGTRHYAVYASAGQIWGCISTDGGTTWLGEKMIGDPIAGGEILRNPVVVSRAYNNATTGALDDYVFIAYEKYNSAENKTYVVFKRYEAANSSTGTPVLTFVSSDLCDLGTGNINTELTMCTTYNTQPLIPVLSVVIVFKPVATGGLKKIWYSAGIGDEGRILYGSFLNVPTEISNTDANSHHPAVGVTPDGFGSEMIHLVWEQWTSVSGGSPLTSDIKYWIPDNPMWQSLPAPINLSSGTGNTLNYSPSITAFIYKDPVTTQTKPNARVVWVGKQGEQQGQIAPEKPQNSNVVNDPTIRVVFRDAGDPTRHWVFGNTVCTPSIKYTTFSSGITYFIGWSQLGTGTNFNNYYVNSSLSAANIRTIAGANGRDMQLITGNSLLTTKAFVNTGNAAPYAFTVSPFQAGLAKSSADASTSDVQAAMITSSAVGGNVTSKENTDLTLHFSLGDISVDGNPVEFADAPDSLKFTSDSLLNKYLKSNEFELTNDSKLTYSVSYAPSGDSVAHLFANGGSLNFKVQLVDVASAEVLGTFDNVTYNSTNTTLHDNILYKVNTTGIGSRKVKLLLIVSNNIAAETKYDYVRSAVAEPAGDVLVKSKSGTGENAYKGFGVLIRNSSKVKEVTFKGVEIKSGNAAGKITTYDLSQNYPNPFNPTTVINYQLPKAGRVTLRIYDMLGKEVIKLVDEEKSAGSYQAEFNASHLSSGVYFYQLECNDFKSIKKMTLIK